MVILCCGEKRRLRCLGKLPGVVCFAAFAGDAFAVQPGFGNQVERVRRKGVRKGSERGQLMVMTYFVEGGGAGDLIPICGEGARVGLISLRSGATSREKNSPKKFAY